MKPTSAVVFSAKRGDWPTPAGLYARLDAEFHFTLDACANRENAKAPLFFTVEDDGLGRQWAGVVWCNPPYGRDIGSWVRKAHQSAARGATVVMLLPARTDVDWWHRYALRAAEIRFVRGRVRFDGARVGAPFPSVLVVFRPMHMGPPAVLSFWSAA